jgi:hypothetical protein
LPPGSSRLLRSTARRKQSAISKSISAAELG